MKIFTTILLILSVVLIITNACLLDFNQVTEGKSMVALIGVVASSCSALIILIFRLSKKIEEKLKK